MTDKDLPHPASQDRAFVPSGSSLSSQSRPEASIPCADLWAVSAVYFVDRGWATDAKNLLILVWAASKEEALAKGKREANEDEPGCRDLRVMAVKAASMIGTGQ